MIEYKNINPGESGLSVRAKINKMFLDLINGNEGANNIWKELLEVTNKLRLLESNIGIMYNGLKEQVLRSFDYTDATAEDLRTYINGMNGGISGFAVDTSFNPDFPVDKAATVLAAGAGTYVNMLDINGDPITIEDSDALTIFYKGANSTYWQYKSIYARIFENGNEPIDIGAYRYDLLDDYNSQEKKGWYVIQTSQGFGGHLLVTGDDMGHVIHQFIFSDYDLGDSGTINRHKDDTPSVIVRTYNLRSSTIEETIPVGTWGKWRYLQDTFISQELGNNKNITVSQNTVNSTIDGVFETIKKKDISSFSWDNVLSKSEIYGLSEKLTSEVVESNDNQVGKILKVSNATDSAIAFSENAYVSIPWGKELNISVWRGSNVSTSGHFIPMFNLLGVVSTGAVTYGRTLYTLKISRINAKDLNSIKTSIDTAGKYELTTSIDKFSTLENVTVVENLTAYIDAYKYIGDAIYFHVVITAQNVLEVNYIQLNLKGDTFYLYPGKFFTTGALNLEIKGKNSFNVESEKIVTDYTKVQLINTVNDEEDNLISDQFDGVGNMYWFDTQFNLTEAKLFYQSRLTTTLSIRKSEDIVIVDGIGIPFRMKGYTFYDEAGSDLPVYSSNTKDNPIFNIKPPYYVNDNNTYEYVDSYTFQFWINLNELNGNMITRVHNYNTEKINIQCAPQGTITTIANYNNPETWKDKPIGIEIIAKIGNMLCIRCPNIKNDFECKWSIMPATWEAYKGSGNPIKTLTIYNPVLLKGDCYPSPWKRYMSRSEKDASAIRGKNVLLIGDSQYNNGILANMLVRKFGCNFYDMHYGGHRLSIGPNYSGSTNVNSISHSWFYQETYRKLVLQQKIDYYILTMSTNDNGDTNWTGEIDEGEITKVESNYPTIGDILNTDKTAYNEKMALFNAMDNAEKNNTFGFVGTYCAYIKQMLEVNPLSQLYICTVPVSCSGYLTGTAIPNPDNVSENIGEWAEGKSPDVAREGLEERFLLKDEQIRAVAKRYHAKVIDIRSECGLTYENFIYHCSDGTHWFKDIARNCAEVIARFFTKCQ